MSNVPAGSHTLDFRHKASLQKFVDKNEWIQDKIGLLESAALPSIDAEDASLDNATLAGMITEHELLDVQVQQLDNGELRSLRLLAKAASQKNLSPEDTDLIEITLTVLFSVDKLLHLLRIRSKALALLQLKAKWEASTRKVQDDLLQLLQETVPSFVKKARWTEPEDVLTDAKRQSRLSASFTSQSSTKDGSPTSLRNAASSSAMARQMRAEIIALALASLTSRLHTLTHSTLLASGKILDTMIDTSPTPLPERFLDFQDDLEAGVKDSVAGLGDFCQALAKQWREVDDAYWTCRELTLALEALQRDIEQATLKLPSEDYAKAFEERLHPVIKTFQELQTLLPGRLTMPLLPARVPDQQDDNVRVHDFLSVKIRATLQTVEAAQQAVRSYRRAASALSAAQAYQCEVIQMLAHLRERTHLLPQIPLDVSALNAQVLDIDTAEKNLRTTKEFAEEARDKLAPRAADILKELAQTGIDPNVRKALQDNIMTLLRQAKEIAGLADNELETVAIVRTARRVTREMEIFQIQLEHLEKRLVEAVTANLWREGTSDNAAIPAVLEDDLQSCRKRCHACVNSAESLTMTLSKLAAQKADLGTAQLLSRIGKQVSHLQTSFKMSEATYDLLQRAAKQCTEILAVEAEARQLEADLKEEEQKLASIVGWQDPLQHETEALGQRVEAFNSNLVRNVTFLAGSNPRSDIDLTEHDDSVRKHLNQASMQLTNLRLHSKQQLSAIEQACACGKQIDTLQSQLQTVTSALSRLDAEPREAGDGVLQQLHAYKDELAKLKADLADLQSTFPSAEWRCPPPLLENLKRAHVDAGQVIQSSADRIRHQIQAVERAMQAEEKRMADIEAEKRKQAEAKAEAQAEELRRGEAQVQLSSFVSQMDDTKGRMFAVQESLHGGAHILRTCVWDGQTAEAERLAASRQDLQARKLELEELLAKVSDLRHGDSMSLAQYHDLAKRKREELEVLDGLASSIQSEVRVYERELELALAQHRKAVVDRQQREELEFHMAEIANIRANLAAFEEELTQSETFLQSNKKIAEQASTVSDLQAIHPVKIPECDFPPILAKLADLKTFQLPAHDIQQVAALLARVRDRHAALEAARQRILQSVADRGKQLQEVEDSELDMPKHEPHIEDSRLGVQGNTNTSLTAEEPKLPEEPVVLQDVHSAKVEQSQMDVGSSEANFEHMEPSRSEGAREKANQDVFGPMVTTDRHASSSNVHPHDDVSESSSRSESPRNGSFTHGDNLYQETKSVEAIPTAPLPILESPDVYQKITAAEAGINRAMDAVDSGIAGEGTHIANISHEVEKAMAEAESAGKTTAGDARVQQRLQQLRKLWTEIHQHLLEPDSVPQHSGSTTRSVSSASSTTSQSSRVPRRSASVQERQKLDYRNGQQGQTSTSRRVVTAGVHSKLSVLALRDRKDSTASQSHSATPPPVSRLPRPVSSASHSFLAPTLSSSARRTPAAKHYSILSPRGVPRIPTPVSARAVSAKAEQIQEPVGTPIRKKRSSNRRSSGAFRLEDDSRPNAYRANPKHKLDIAVERIVNDMSVPVSITAADTHHDEVGKYWIGDPPKLYYARILRSRTVMVRVGGGWQELSSFLSTHFDQMFAPADETLSENLTPLRDSNRRNTLHKTLPGDNEHWISASSLKAGSSGSTTPRRQSLKLSRSMTNLKRHSHPHKTRSSDVPFDLTALLIKSTSRSPPAGQASKGQRNITSPIPWRI